MKLVLFKRNLHTNCTANQAGEINLNFRIAT